MFYYEYHFPVFHSISVYGGIRIGSTRKLSKHAIQKFCSAPLSEANRLGEIQRPTPGTGVRTPQSDCMHTIPCACCILMAY